MVVALAQQLEHKVARQVKTARGSQCLSTFSRQIERAEREQHRIRTRLAYGRPLIRHPRAHAAPPRPSPVRMCPIAFATPSANPPSGPTPIVVEIWVQGQKAYTDEPYARFVSQSLVTWVHGRDPSVNADDMYMSTSSILLAPDPSSPVQAMVHVALPTIHRRVGASPQHVLVGLYQHPQVGPQVTLPAPLSCVTTSVHLRTARLDDLQNQWQSVPPTPSKSVPR